LELKKKLRGFKNKLRRKLRENNGKNQNLGGKNGTETKQN